jgi:hypothetical protein
MPLNIVTLGAARKYTDTSILGTTGPLHGKSAYEIAVDHGYTGSEDQFVTDQHGYPPFIISASTTPSSVVGNWAVYDSVTAHGYIDSGIKAEGTDGANGSNGADGVGISDISITYQNSTSGTSAPVGGTWTASPSPVQGEFVWSKIVITKTDLTSQTLYSVAYQGEDGSGEGSNYDNVIVATSKTDFTAPTSEIDANRTLFIALDTSLCYVYNWSSTDTDKFKIVGGSSSSFSVDSSLKGDGSSTTPLGVNIDENDTGLSIVSANTPYTKPWTSTDSRSDQGMCAPIVATNAPLPVSLTSSETGTSEGIEVDNSQVAGGSTPVDETIYMVMVAVDFSGENPVFKERTLTTLGTMAAQSEGSLPLNPSATDKYTYTISDDDKLGCLA